jgi:NADH-quinone oxidoreductase subunit A
LLDNFGTLGIFVAVAIVFPLLLIGLPLVFRYTGIIPQHPNSVKQDIYESGMKPFKGAWTQFNFHYYTFAILFVVMDVMSVFLFPWAANFIGLESSEQIWALLSVVVFVAILLVGFVYAWRKKALEWK